MEESFKEGSKDYKGKRSVQNKLSENRGNNIVTIVTIVNYIKYSEKIVNTKKTLGAVVRKAETAWAQNKVL